MPTPIWAKVKDEAKTLAGSAEVEAEKLKQWALTGEDSADAVVDKVQSKGWTVYIIAGVAALVVLAWMLG